jgi:exodeoxyribonuclease VII small subunit
MAEKKENISFEDAMKRLDKICEELSREGVELENALALYEEGVKLVRVCNKKLEATERKINMLRVSAQGELLEEEFVSSDI